MNPTPKQSTPNQGAAKTILIRSLAPHVTRLGCLCCLLSFTTSASAAPAGEMRCDQRVFGRMPEDTEVKDYTLTNVRGMRVKVMELGATLTELWVPDARSAITNVVLGFDRLETYLARPSYMGAVVGRVANRIANGKFDLDGKTYTLSTNGNGRHHLHGGFRGFDKQVWSSRALPATASEMGVEFRHVSADGEEGYPGRMAVKVVYTLTTGGVLRIDYAATADRATPVNLSNHSFFNLAGTGDILNHRLRINAARYTPTDATLIPTGELAPVAGTGLDFTTPRRIGERMGPGTSLPAGYDHNFVLNAGDGQLAFCARLVDPASGRVMEVWTTEPGLQFNTANRFDGRFVGMNGQAMTKHAGCALETQHFPDSVNRPQFPSTILRPEMTFQSTTEFRFSVQH